MLDYFCGNKAFYLFVNDYTSNSPQSKFILKKEYNLAARVGCISNILLSIKESLVSKKNGASSRVSFGELESSITYLCTEETNGYRLGNYVFPNAATVILVLRNKIGHGEFKLDLEHGRLIINYDNTEIPINIDKLSTYIISNLKSFIKLNNSNHYEREIFYSEKKENNRHKLLNNNELDRFFKTFKKLEIKLTKKDGTLIDKNVQVALEDAISYFNEKHDTRLLLDFANSVKEDYDFDFKIISLKNCNFEQLKKNMSELEQISTYDEQVNIAAREISNNFGNFKNFNLVFSNLTNLIMLQIIYKYNTVDMNVIREKFSFYYKDFYFNSCNIADIGISLFNSLFSCGIDKLYRNNNIFTLNDNDGLDYSKLNLSKINVKYLDLETSIIDDLKDKVRGKQNDLTDINNRIGKTEKSLRAIKINKRPEIEKLLSEKLDLLREREKETISLLKNISSELFTASTYFNNNQEYLKKMRIIEGIRNSIAHNNYYIELSDNKLFFEDIYEGKLTFKCEVDIYEFIDLILKNSLIIKEYIDSKNNQKIKH